MLSVLLFAVLGWSYLLPAKKAFQQGFGLLAAMPS
jgi:hypothetical protein